VLAGCGAPQDGAPGAGADADVATLTARAEQGDAEAQYALGLRYAQGNGVTKNAFMGVQWFRAAAEQGHPLAQFEMGSAYVTGEGAQPNIAEGTQWYRRAAPNMEEAAILADYLEAVRDGTDGADDLLDQGLWLFNAGDDTSALEKLVPFAAEHNHALSYYLIGTIDLGFARALDFEADPADRETLEASAMGNFRQAAEAGFAWAQLSLAEMYLAASWAPGGDDRAEAAEARRWYQAAADQGLEAALEGIALVDRAIYSDTPPAAQPTVAVDIGRGPEICARIVGRWQWYTDAIPGVLTFAMPNRVGAAANAGGPELLSGTWTCDPATATFTITWPNGVIETLTIAGDGGSVGGRNNFGSLIRGTPLR